MGYEPGITGAAIKAHIAAIFGNSGISNRTRDVIMLSKMSLNSEDAVES